MLKCHEILIKPPPLFMPNRHKNVVTHYTLLLWHQVNNFLLTYRIKTLCISLHEHQPFSIPRTVGCAMEEERFASFPHRCRHQYTQFALYNFNFWSSFIGSKVFHLKFSEAFVTFSASTLEMLNVIYFHTCPPAVQQTVIC